MEWVKSLTGYYRLLEIATGSDAMEVMFKRADALAGELGSDGFIPDAMLPQLARRPAQAKKLAADLVKAGLWVRVRGGYMIVDWSTINAELVRLHARKKRDRDRKRADRAASRDVSTDASVDGSADAPADSPVDSLYESERKTKKKTAAAAAVPDPPPLPPSLEILKARLEAAKLTAQWHRLTAEQHDEIEHLIEVHGDVALVKSALAQYRPGSPAVFAQAWLPGWRALVAPGAGLQLVTDPPCPKHEAQGGTTRHCASCAADRLAGDA
jgi:hypothetical protein